MKTLNDNQTQNRSGKNEEQKPKSASSSTSSREPGYPKAERVQEPKTSAQQGVFKDPAAGHPAQQNPSHNPSHPQQDAKGEHSNTNQEHKKS